MTNGAALPPGWANHASQAQPVVPVDPTTGDAVSWSSIGGGGGGGGGSSTDVAIHDAITTTQHLVVNPDGSINVNPSSSSSSTSINDGTTATQKAAVDVSGNLAVKLGAALPAGTNVLGHVIIDSAGNVAITSMPALPAGTALIGHVILDSGTVSLSAALPAGTNAIGTVGVTSLPAIPSGSNAIGTVGVTALPALPTGSNAIGSVSVSNLPATQPISGSVSVSNLPVTQPVSGTVSVNALPAGTAVIGHVILDSGSVSLSAALPAGSNALGTVGVTALPSLPAGAALIGHVIVDSAGAVSVTSLPALPAGTNSIGTVGLNAGSNLIGTAQLMDSAGVNVAGVDSSHNQLVKVNAALPAGSALLGGLNLVDSLGTNKASIDASGNQAVKGGYLEMASLTAGSLNADLVASTDVSAYKALSLHVTGTFTGTLSFYGSNDNTNFVLAMLYRGDTDNTGNATSASALSNIIWWGPIRFRYFRVRMTAYTSGTATGTLELYAMPPPQTTVASSVTQSGTWTMQMPTSATGTITSVAGSVTAGGVQLLASNTARKGMYVFNESSAVLYLAFAGTATITAYTVQVPANSFFEMPTAPVYTGAIWGIWSSAVGSARISEMS